MVDQFTKDFEVIDEISILLYDIFKNYDIFYVTAANTEDCKVNSAITIWLNLMENVEHRFNIKNIEYSLTKIFQQNIDIPLSRKAFLIKMMLFNDVNKIKFTNKKEKKFLYNVHSVLSLIITRMFGTNFAALSKVLDHYRLKLRDTMNIGSGITKEEWAETQKIIYSIYDLAVIVNEIMEKVMIKENLKNHAENQI